MCPECDNENETESENCEMCEAPRPKDKIIPQPMVSKPNKPTPWICPECDNENTEGETNCSMCEAPAPEA